MSLLEDLSEGKREIEEWYKQYTKVKRRAEAGELIEIIKTGEVKKVRLTFMGGVHIDDFHFSSVLDDEYLVLERRLIK
jgi:hypothetical protein